MVILDKGGVEGETEQERRTERGDEQTDTYITHRNALLMVGTQNQNLAGQWGQWSL